MQQRCFPCTYPCGFGQITDARKKGRCLWLGKLKAGHPHKMSRTVPHIKRAWCCQDKLVLTSTKEAAQHRHGDHLLVLLHLHILFDGLARARTRRKACKVGWRPASNWERQRSWRVCFASESRLRSRYLHSRPGIPDGSFACVQSVVACMHMCRARGPALLVRSRHVELKCAA